MPWYIRLAKLPELSHSSSSSTKKSPSTLLLTFSFEIRNDLGESLLPHSARILSTIIFSPLSTSLPPLTSTVLWDPAKWISNVSIPIPPSHLNQSSKSAGTQRQIRVTLQAEGENELKVEGCVGLRYIYPTTSDWLPLTSGSRAEPFALRRLPGGLQVWEGTGRSIAAHVWDAGIVLCGHLCYLSQLTPEDERKGEHESHELATLLISARREKRVLKVLELGAGCGISGLVLSQQFPACSVELTDVHDAVGLLERNVAEAEADAPTTGARIGPRECYALDWESETDCSAARERVRERDLILVSDCTYNVDMVGRLVTALKAVANGENTLVAVALKRRHEDEERFFVEMGAKGFGHVRKHVFRIPSTDEEEMVGLEPKDIELHLFRYGG